ncbi:MAG: glycoside hydrolase, partial [Anaerolineae bacterium]|nr:glycoside hydrolase [Anaerolineae bacterium]
LYDELLPNFTSRTFNVGCDETFDLGLGKSKDMVAQQGKGRVYLDFLLAIYKRVQARGYTMQFWGDIINQYPDLVPELPRDAIALEWGYEADHDFPGKSKLFADSGIPFYVCPGTSSWRTIAGRTDNCLGNIRNAVESGLQYGATGVLNTDWGDDGHWQPLPVSYLGFAYGSAVSWAYAPNRDIDLPVVLDTFLFKDEAEVMGRLAYELGNVYQEPGILLPNSSLLFVAYFTTLAEMRQNPRLEHAPEAMRALINDDDALRATLETTLAAIDRVMEPLESTQIGSRKADLLKREFSLAARMLRHGAKRLLFQLEDSPITAREMAEDIAMIIAEYRAVWTKRNRPGGLSDSVARLEQAGELYTQA